MGSVLFLSVTDNRIRRDRVRCQAHCRRTCTVERAGEGTNRQARPAASQARLGESARLPWTTSGRMAGVMIGTKTYRQQRVDSNHKEIYEALLPLDHAGTARPDSRRIARFYVVRSGDATCRLRSS